MIRNATLCALALLCVLPCHVVRAQGLRSDYERADRIASTFEGLVRNADVRVRWLDAGTPVYQYELPDGTAEWRTMDLDTGETRPAFDAGAIRAALRERGAEGDAPIGWFDLRHGRLLFMRSGDPRLWSWGDGTLEPLDPADLPEGIGIPPSDTDRTRSGGPATRLFVINALDEPVRVLWLDHAGTSREYAQLKPGGTHEQGTYTGHAWRVETLTGESLGVYEATEDPGLVFVRRGVRAPEAPEPARNERVSPDGRHEIVFRAHNVVLIDLQAGTETVLTDDGTVGNRYEGPVRWSPDSTRFVVMKTEPGSDRRVTIVESSPSDRVEPRVIEFGYRKPGDDVDRSVPRLFDAASGELIPTDDTPIENPWSVGRVRWRGDSSAFTYLYNARGHQTVRYVRVDAATGRTNVVINETCDTFIDWTNKVEVHELDDAGEIVWMSERSGWNHLYLIDAGTGAIKRALTEGPFVVRSVESVDAEERTALIRIMGYHEGQDPYHVHWARVALDTAELTLLTEGDGTHRIAFSPDGRYLVDTWSRVDLAPVTEIRRAGDGSRVGIAAEGDLTRLIGAGWSPPERFVAKGRDGTTDIWGFIQRPTNFDAARTYPVIESIYAGPHGHHVPKDFAVWRGSRSLAELGFVTVHIDGMGTNWRSKAFHDVAYKNLRDAGFPDRIAWMRAAGETRPWMDLDRVGIYGVSAGGQNALGALLFHGDFYKAAVADCGCHDNRMDKIWWNEQWMGWPVDDSYAASSNVEHAGNLTGDLLLTVGELDQNVDPASTMQVVDALIRADKDFELIVFPGLGHGTIGSPYGQRRLRDFFVRSLLDVEPRREGQGG